ncbi:MAG: hypothetical protein F6J86_45540 [Symploca sp. SIO1B1]|nr:hypothetical protein [Symploca sp. SIO1B1]
MFAAIGPKQTETIFKPKDPKNETVVVSASNAYEMLDAFSTNGQIGQVSQVVEQGRHGGNFTILTEKMPSGEKRTLSIQGEIKNWGSKDRKGGKKYDILRGAFDHFGHLIGYQFGGPDHKDTKNIHSQHAHANKGDYLRLENSIKSELNKRGSGVMTVSTVYEDAGTRASMFIVKVVWPDGHKFDACIDNFGNYQR